MFLVAHLLPMSESEKCWSWRGRGYSQESVDKRCTVEETPGKPLLCWWAEMVAVCELSLLPITPQRPQRWPALHLGFLGVVLVRDVLPHESLHMSYLGYLGLHCLAQNVSHLWRFLSFCCLHIELVIGGHLEREWLWICCDTAEKLSCAFISTNCITGLV